MSNKLEIFVDLLRSPDAEVVYRRIKSFYLDSGMAAEADAIQYLIDSKFGGENETNSDGSDACQGQPFDHP